MQMKRTLTLLTACLTISGCMTPQGSYCSVYQPLNLNREAATALVDLDRDAAVAAITNEDSYGACG
jgi:hypothetical protein